MSPAQCHPRNILRTLALCCYCAYCCRLLLEISNCTGGSCQNKTYPTASHHPFPITTSPHQPVEDLFLLLYTKGIRSAVYGGNNTCGYNRGTLAIKYVSVFLYNIGAQWVAKGFRTTIPYRGHSARCSGHSAMQGATISGALLLFIALQRY